MILKRLRVIVLLFVHAALPICWHLACSSFIHKMVELTVNPTNKQILKDLELKGGRDKADFLDICNKNKGFYGVKGSSVRRTYQRAVDRIKRNLTAQEYFALVEANDLTPCSQTKNDAMEELKQAMAKATISDTAETAPTAPDKPTTETKRAPAETKPAPAKKVAVVEPARSKTPPPTTSHFMPGSPLFKTLFSPPESSVTSHTEPTGSEYDNLHIALLNEGDPNTGWSPSNPHIIAVNGTNTVLPHGFVSMVCKKAQGFGAHDRDVHFISKVIGGDRDKWKAWIPSGFEEFHLRCYMVEGPGLDFIQIDSKVLLDSLEATCNIQNCPITTALSKAFKRAVEKLKHAFARSKKKNQFYLFVYPPGTVFDNEAVSGKDAADKVKTFGIKVNCKFGIFTRKEHTNMVGFWAMATVPDEEDRNDAVQDGLSEDVYGF